MADTTSSLPTLPDLPEFLQSGLASTTILSDMLATLPTTVDQAEGSFIWDALAPAAVQLAQAAIWIQQALARSFASYTFGAYLDLRAAEHGVTRNPAVSATGQVTFTGVPGTVIPIGTQVATSSTNNVPSEVFTTTEAAIIPAGGSVTVAISDKLTPDASGNVSANTIILLVTPIQGITQVNNANPTTGGADEESDSTFLARYLTYVRNPPAGGNAADYINWALAASSNVGLVQVVPIWNGNGTVGVYIVDTSDNPAGQSLIDTVQAYIAPSWSVVSVASSSFQPTSAGLGVTSDTSQSDSITGTCWKIVYNNSSDVITYGTISSDISQYFNNLTPSRSPQPGIWQARIRLKVSAATGTQLLHLIEIVNGVSQARLQTTPSGGSAAQYLKGTGLSTGFTDIVQNFYWNGTDQVKLNLSRIENSLSVATAITLSHTPASTTLGAGTYYVSYSWVRGIGSVTGETAASAQVSVIITAGDNITFTLPNPGYLDTTANVYVSQAAGSTTVKLYATGRAQGASVTITGLGTGVTPPASSTAGGDTTTTTWFDQVKDTSTFSTDTGSGKAPIGASVSVMAPATIAINVSATLTIAAGYDISTVRTNVSTAITAYLKSTIFNTTNTNIQVARIGITILDIEGVTDYSNLLIGKAGGSMGASNVIISPGQIPIAGTYTWS